MDNNTYIDQYYLGEPAFSVFYIERGDFDEKTILGALLMAATMMVLPVSQADADFKLPGVKINLPGNNKGPAPAAPAKVANSISVKNETLREIIEDHRRQFYPL